MVNYCCVSGCGRNSRSHNHLNYYGIPRDRKRQMEWLKAASRDDLLKSGDVPRSYRICSRHFETSCMKSNKLLFNTAVPTLHLEGDTKPDEQVTEHHSLTCNKCKQNITGYRYMCVTCKDYDLCLKCEMHQQHSQHFMIRIPKAVTYTQAGKMADSLKRVVEKMFEDAESSSNSDNSSDEEPISSYLKRSHDEGIDLTEDVKQNIRKEIQRALTASNKTVASDLEGERSMDNARSETENFNDLLGEYLKKDAIQEVEFANVEEDNSLLNLVKEEDVSTTDNPMSSASVVLSDSLAEFLKKKDTSL